MVILGGVFITSDGLSLYYSDTTNKQIHQCTLATAWDLSTIGSVESTSPDITGTTFINDTLHQEHGFYIKPDDGTKLYFITRGVNTIYEWTMTTPWNISTLTGNGNTITGQHEYSRHIWIN